jgi:hypothetical protein
MGVEKVKKKCRVLFEWPKTICVTSFVKTHFLFSLSYQSAQLCRNGDGSRIDKYCDAESHEIIQDSNKYSIDATFKNLFDET